MSLQHPAMSLVAIHATAGQWMALAVVLAVTVVVVIWMVALARRNRRG